MASVRVTHLRADDTALIRDLYPKLRRFAAAVAPSEVDPDDVVQEALVKTIRRQPISALEHPSAYLWKTIDRLATDHRRRLGRQRRALGRIGPPELEYPRYPSDLDELERLTPKARAVLYLREVDGYSYAEIAELLDANEASLRRTASRARRSLRKALCEEEPDAATS
jgi:RNA polymerase sigma-70 factor (ECF subfamily)